MQLVRTRVATDAFGDGTSDPSQCTIRGALFEPIAPEERAGDGQVRVLDTGYWNLPGLHKVAVDDLIKDGTETWQVVGGGVHWLNRTKVAVEQAKGRA